MAPSGRDRPGSVDLVADPLALQPRTGRTATEARGKGGAAPADCRVASQRVVQVMGYGLRAAGFSTLSRRLHPRPRGIPLTTWSKARKRPRRLPRAGRRWGYAMGYAATRSAESGSFSVTYTASTRPVRSASQIKPLCSPGHLPLALHLSFA